MCELAIADQCAVVVSHIVENHVDQGHFTDDVLVGITVEHDHVAVFQDLCVENNQAAYDVWRPDIAGKCQKGGDYANDPRGFQHAVCAPDFYERINGRQGYDG